MMNKFNIFFAIIIIFLTYPLKAELIEIGTDYIIPETILKFENGKIRFTKLSSASAFYNEFDGLFREDIELDCKTKEIRLMGEVFHITESGSVIAEVGKRDFILKYDEAADHHKNLLNVLCKQMQPNF
jgi:hypothetical protein